MKYFIETYGCQMNVHDSERMAGLLEASGYERASGEADADVVVINTCSVREKAEDKLYARLADLKGLARATGHEPIVAVAGCVAQQEGAKLLDRSPLIDVVMGTQRVKMLPLLVTQARNRQTADTLSAIVDVDTPYKIIAACIVKMGEVAFSDAYDEGQKMSMDQAVALALNDH